MANKRFTDKGRQYILDRANGSGGAAIDVDYHLFQSNITPTENDNDATYAGSEATFTGYAAARVNTFGASTAVGNQRVSVATAVSFVVGASPSITNNIYGYYATTHGTTNVLWALRFDGAPLSMTAAGATIQITPLLSDQSQYA